MKVLGYVDSYAMEIGGWSKNDGRAYSSYNNGSIPLKQLKIALDKLKFPMIDWKKLKNRPKDVEIKPIRSRAVNKKVAQSK